jgi:hypothetical protein
MPVNGSSTPVYDTAGNTYRVTDKATGKELFLIEIKERIRKSRNEAAKMVGTPNGL